MRRCTVQQLRYRGGGGSRVHIWGKNIRRPGANHGSQMPLDAHGLADSGKKITLGNHKLTGYKQGTMEMELLSEDGDGQTAASDCGTTNNEASRVEKEAGRKRFLQRQLGLERGEEVRGLVLENFDWGEEMGSQLHQALRSLCLSTDWKYAVFWKLQHRTRMMLTWEDAYYDKHDYHDPSEKKCVSEMVGNVRDGHYSHDPIGLAVAKMSYHIHVIYYEPFETLPTLAILALIVVVDSLAPIVVVDSLAPIVVVDSLAPIVASPFRLSLSLPT
ncbi:hypothetical protein RJ640_019607, partial [Escallonia rubra]